MLYAIIDGRDNIADIDDADTPLRFRYCYLATPHTNITIVVISMPLISC